MNNIIINEHSGATINGKIIIDNLDDKEIKNLFKNGIIEYIEADSEDLMALSIMGYTPDRAEGFRIPQLDYVELICYEDSIAYIGDLKYKSTKEYWFSNKYKPLDFPYNNNLIMECIN